MSSTTFQASQAMIANSASADRVRMARALLERHAGRAADAQRRSGETPAAPRLADALKPVIGWLRARLGGAETLAGEATDRLTQDYTTLRLQWDSHEAHRIAARMAATDREDAPPAVAPQVAAAGVPRRRALLVDDASDILVIVGAFLTGFGFDVVRASSGDIALQCLADGKPTDLLVTDHAMQGMTGHDLVTQAMAMHPRLRALIITGYPGVHELSKLPPNVLLLGKPFRRERLAEQIRRLFEDENLNSAVGV